MPRHLLLSAMFASVAMLIGANLLPVQAKAPAPIKEVAPLKHLTFELSDRINEIEKLLVSQEAFDKEKSAEQLLMAFGTLACVGQAIAEHPDQDVDQVAGVAVREAAKKYEDGVSYDDAQAALAALKEAANGGGDKTAEVEHPWDELIDMYSMMEEINTRNGKVLRVLRRVRGKEDEPVHASIIAVLSLAMCADTSYIDEKDTARWQELALEYQALMSEVATAIEKKDGDTAKTKFLEATESCKVCHKEFRDA